MAYIDQVKVGSTTYDLHDRRLENPVDFMGVVTLPSTGTVSLAASATGDDQTLMWKMGNYASSSISTCYAFYKSGTTQGYLGTSNSAASGFTLLGRVYPGDQVYCYDNTTTVGSTSWAWNVVPSADNPHTHSIPALTGIAASAGGHTHSVTAAGTLSSAGSHSHPITLSGTTGNHSHTYTVPTQADSAGGHTHKISIPTKTVNVTVTRNTATGSASQTTHSHGVTDPKHTHSFTTTSSAVGSSTTGITLGSAGKHKHTFTGTVSTHSHTVDGVTVTVSGTILTVAAKNYTTSEVALTPAGSLDEQGGHSHSVNDNGHTHSYVTIENISSATTGITLQTAQPGITVTWSDYTATGSLPAFDVTSDSNGAHTHALSGTSANKNTGNTNLNLSATSTAAGAHSHDFIGSSVNTSTSGAHTHDVTTNASTTGSGQ